VWILLVILTYMHHDARFRECKLKMYPLKFVNDTLTLVNTEAVGYNGGKRGENVGRFSPHFINLPFWASHLAECTVLLQSFSKFPRSWLWIYLAGRKRYPNDGPWSWINVQERWDIRSYLKFQVFRNVTSCRPVSCGGS